jgi:hypothetical protein
MSAVRNDLIEIMTEDGTPVADAEESADAMLVAHADELADVIMNGDGASIEYGEPICRCAELVRRYARGEGF